MSKRIILQHGEIATIITIASLIILGASTLVSSVFLSKNKQTISTRASYAVESCNSGNNWHCTGQTLTCGGVACGKCSKSGTNNWVRCVGPNCRRNQSSTVYNYPVFDSDSSCAPVVTNAQTATTIPTKILSTGCPSNQCTYDNPPCVSRNAIQLSTQGGLYKRCCYPGSTSEWVSSYSYPPPACSASTPMPTAIPTRDPKLELSGYEKCARCCIQDIKCGMPADGNGYKCEKYESRIRWYSYNCTGKPEDAAIVCDKFNKGGYPSTKFIACPNEVGREKPLKCVGPEYCTTGLDYSGLPLPTTAISPIATAEPTVDPEISSQPLSFLAWCNKQKGYSCGGYMVSSNLHTNCSKLVNGYYEIKTEEQAAIIYSYGESDNIPPIPGDFNFYGYFQTVCCVYQCANNQTALKYSKDLAATNNTYPTPSPLAVPTVAVVRREFDNRLFFNCSLISSYKNYGFDSIKYYTDTLGKNHKIIVSCSSSGKHVVNTSESDGGYSLYCCD